MTTPVIVTVSRMQNRRGTQEQFDALYPVYPGIGTQILQPGELALCTDSRRVFIGNINGEYIEVGNSVSGGATQIGTLPIPITVLLPPSVNFVLIPSLTHTRTPFLTIVYSVSDATINSVGAVGTTFSKNGELILTAMANLVSMTDAGTVLNTTTNDIYFKSTINANNLIEISYKHNFPTNLVFSTNTVVWASISATTSTSSNATYELSSPAIVHSGEVITVTLTTTHVTDGTAVPYTLGGVSSSDINNDSLSGNFIVRNNSATIQLTGTLQPYVGFTANVMSGNSPLVVSFNGIEPDQVLSVGLSNGAANTTTIIGHAA